jgi:hypothetical protein
LVIEWDGKTPLEQIVNKFANKDKEDGVVFLASRGWRWLFIWERGKE